MVHCLYVMQIIEQLFDVSYWIFCFKSAASARAALSSAVDAALAASDAAACSLAFS